MIKQSKMIGLMAFLFLSAFTACDDDNDDNGMPDPGAASYSFTVTGDVEFDAEGEVFFAAYYDPEFEEDIFLLNMMPKDDAADMNLMFIKGGSQPGTDTYPIVYHDEMEAGGFLEDAFVSRFNVTFEENDMPTIYFFEAEEGSITFEESGSDRVSGSFSYHAKGYNVMEEANELHIEISGTFDAAYADPGDPDF